MISKKFEKKQVKKWFGPEKKKHKKPAFTRVKVKGPKNGTHVAIRRNSLHHKGQVGGETMSRNSHQFQLGASSARCLTGIQVLLEFDTFLSVVFYNSIKSTKNFKVTIGLV